MKILLAGTVDLSTQRGDTLHFLHLANALRLRGHNLDIVGLNKPSSSRWQDSKFNKDRWQAGFYISNEFDYCGRSFSHPVITMMFYQQGIPL
jgi:hypothetical protein